MITIIYFCYDWREYDLECTVLYTMWAAPIKQHCGNNAEKHWTVNMVAIMKLQNQPITV